MATRSSPARDLAVVLHDLAWLLPRTVGAPAAAAEPLPASELELMRLLSRRPGLSVNEAARELGMRPNNVSATVRSLEARGVLRRSTDGADARVVRLTPTAAARGARDRREASWGAQLASVLGRLPDEQRAALIDAINPLRALAAALTVDNTGHAS